MFYAIEYQRIWTGNYCRKNLRLGGFKDLEKATKILCDTCKKHLTQGEVLEYGKPIPVVIVGKNHEILLGKTS